MRPLDINVLRTLDEHSLAKRLENVSLLYESKKRVRQWIELGIKEGQKALDDWDEETEFVRVQMKKIELVILEQSMGKLE